MKYLAFFDSGIGLAYLSGIFALVLIIATALLVFLKTRLVNRHPSRRDLITKTHMVLATLGGAFLLLHADYFIRAPIFDPWIFLGYLSTAVDSRSLVHGFLFYRTAQVFPPVPRFPFIICDCADDHTRSGAGAKSATGDHGSYPRRAGRRHLCPRYAARWKNTNEKTTGGCESLV